MQSLIKVVAFYHFQEGRICPIDELTHVLQDHGSGQVFSKLNGVE
ncbi:hypothetical protein AcetOrient_orf04786 [Acetobacter orientalis]|uniref:Uncharacterized protein n=1 Tax=Acetobacter orientalis TaxID=146474 RepID=A0A2Z5ZL89_9PROT|nr:hypothetical protein AcetOrient_orf04786 [Acetobacter orientalis]